MQIKNWMRKAYREGRYNDIPQWAFDELKKQQPKEQEKSFGEFLQKLKEKNE